MIPAENKKIIVFDDDEDILAICAFVLEGAGWQVFTFNNCNDILKRVAVINPAVILMDNWIPQHGGIAATQLLKNSPESAHIPVIYFTANNNISALAAEAGADAHIAKPFDLDDLEKIVSVTATNAA